MYKIGIILIYSILFFLNINVFYINKIVYVM